MNTEMVIQSEADGLDRTPVYDLEVDYDPCAAADLDALLDKFLPLPGGAR